MEGGATASSSAAGALGIAGFIAGGVTAIVIDAKRLAREPRKPGVVSSLQPFFAPAAGGGLRTRGALLTRVAIGAGPRCEQPFERLAGRAGDPHGLAATPLPADNRDRGTPDAEGDRRLQSSPCSAAPSTGGAVTATRRRSPTAGPTAVREARGTTWMSTIKAPSRDSTPPPLTRPGRSRYAARMATASPSRLVRLGDGASHALVYPEQGFQLHGFAAVVDGRAGGAPIELVYGPPGRASRPTGVTATRCCSRRSGVTFGAEADRWAHDGRALPMQQHGWARDAYWHVEAIDERSVTGVLVPTTGIRAGFPFGFELRLRYALEDDALALDAELANRGDEGFPYALGFHPYLRAPLAGGTRRDCRVRLPAGVRLQSADSWRTITRDAAQARTVDAADPRAPGLDRPRRDRRDGAGGRGRCGGRRDPRLRRRERAGLPRLGGLERRPRRSVRLPRAVDRRAERAQPARDPPIEAGAATATG